MLPIALLLCALLSTARAAAPSGDPCAALYTRLNKTPTLKPIPKTGLIPLRVLYLEDRRLPTLSAAGRADLYRRVEALAKPWFGYRVRFSEVAARDLAAEFSRPGPFDDPLQQACFVQSRVEPGAPEDAGLLAGIAERLYARHGALVFDQAFPGTKALSGAKAMHSALAFFTRLYRRLSTLDNAGGPLIGSPVQKRMFSFLHWSAYARWTREADFIVTNATMIEADMSMPLYVLARGGVTTGLTDNNPAAPYGAVAVVTLMPFLSGERFAEPKAPETAPSEILDAAATMWMHELGHFILRVGEQYGEPACVHSASTSLNYFKWHRAIRAAGNRCSKRPAVVERF